MPPVDVLKYGALGLGLVLAFYSFRLVMREQRRDPPRPPMMRLIVFFMAFSLILAGAGFISEYLARKYEDHQRGRALALYNDANITGPLRGRISASQVYLANTAEFLKEVSNVRWQIYADASKGTDSTALADAVNDAARTLQCEAER